jgi:hypothetical protein
MAGHIMGSYIDNFFEIVRPCEEPPNEVDVETSNIAVFEVIEEVEAIIPTPIETSPDEPKNGKIKRDKLKDLEAQGN